jgi:glycosyltransferase involved in cell wall biosynthesis
VGGPRLTVVIPAHREGASIGAVVAKARRFGEVIVVDDCSPDDTSERASAAGALVVRSDAQLGYEGALRRGFAEADERGFTHVVTMDADGEHDPACVARFRQLLLEDGVPLVLGIRARKQRVAETILASYVRARFGPRDILCGMKGYDLALYRANRGFSRSDSIGTELAVHSLRAGVRFEEVPVTGERRSDAPRFDRSLRANLRMLRALTTIMFDDVARRGVARRA